MPTPTITHEQIRDALSRSGYLLEYEVEKILGRNGYFAQANQAYPDPITGKSRELDISAIKAEPITADFHDSIFTIPLIECVNNPQPIGFFTKNPVAPTTHMYDLKFSGLPVKVKKGKHWTKLSGFLDMERYHHHCKGRIATQYCSFTVKKGTTPTEWLAQHEELHFDSFNKLCFALNHDIDEHYSHARLQGKEGINIQTYYPILVVSGDLIEIVPTKKEIKLRAASHIHYVQSYLTAGKEQRFHIDVVTKKYLPRLLTTIDRETTRMVHLIRSRKKTVQRSVDLITSSVKSLRSTAAIRSRMEYRGPWGRHDPS